MKESKNSKEELRKSFEDGNLEEVNQILWGIYNNEITILQKKEIDDLLEILNYNCIASSRYLEIESFLECVKHLNYGETETYRNIVSKLLENKIYTQSLVEYLIKENTLQIVDKDILQALDVKSINFTGEESSNIPHEIIYIKSLEEISFSECDLNSVPKILFDLPLKRLSLYECQFDELSDICDKLQMLEELTLSYNYLYSLPESLKHMKSLKKLILSGNEFEFFPEVICEINGLEVLELNDCKIREIPISFQNLKTLKILDISCNPISPFPKAISNLKSLISLNISNVKEEDKIPDIPSTLKNLSQLKELDISDNDLGYFPLWITELSDLEELSISRNRIKELPIDLGKLRNLKRLWASDNLIEMLPRSIVKLKKIYSIHMSINRFKLIPEFIGEVTSLITLDLTYNRITYVPDSIGNLINLKELNLSMNSLTKIPHTIGRLRLLESLHLNQNRLRRLPQSIKKLEKLRSFYLKNNFFLDLPQDAYNLEEIFNIVEFEEIKVDEEDYKDLSYIEKILKSDNVEKITELFIDRRFDTLEKAELIGLFTNPEIDLINCLIVANLNVDRRDFRDGIDLPEKFYGEIIDKLPELLLGKIEKLEKEEIKILVWMGLDSHLTDDQIHSLSHRDINKYLKAYFEAGWDYLEGNSNHVERFQQKFGKTLSKHFKELIERIVKKGDDSEISRMLHNNWLELLTAEDFLDLISDENLRFLKTIFEIKSGWGYYGLGEKLDGIIFEYVLETVSPNEALVLKELDSLLKKRIIVVYTDYFEDRINAIELRNNHIVNLFLREDDLEKLPESIGNLLYLEILDVDHTILRELPKSIGKLKNLKLLRIIDCDLRELPEEIGMLHRLECLEIISSNLSKLPTSIGNLELLERLDLFGNALKEIPESIGDLKSLEILSLGRNLFTTLPESIANIKSLNEFDIQQNPSLIIPDKLKFLVEDYYDYGASIRLIFETGSDVKDRTALQKIEKYPLPEKYDDWKQKLEAILIKHRLSSHSSMILNAVRDRIIFKQDSEINETITNIGLGRSKLGGLPDVPSDFTWPRWKERPLDFLMQINLADLQDFDFVPHSLKRGFLYFFFDPLQEDWGVYYPKNKEAWRVIYADEEMSNLVRKNNPSHGKNQKVRACKIYFHRDIHLPSQTIHLFETMRGDNFTWSELGDIDSDFLDLRYKLFRYDTVDNNHALFGYPDMIQEGPYLSDWVHLLQLGSDDQLKWLWGGYRARGKLHFYIKEENLKKNHFKDVHMILDCY